MIWLIRKHPYTGALIYFKKIFHFLTFQTSKLPKTVAKKRKNMTSFPCSVRPEKFHPYIALLTCIIQYWHLCKGKPSLTCLLLIFTFLWMSLGGLCMVWLFKYWLLLPIQCLSNTDLRLYNYHVSHKRKFHKRDFLWPRLNEQIFCIEISSVVAQG